MPPLLRGVRVCESSLGHGARLGAGAVLRYCAACLAVPVRPVPTKSTSVSTARVSGRSMPRICGDSLRLEGGLAPRRRRGRRVHAGLQVTGDAAPGNQKLTAGIGARLAYLDGDGSNRSGYALGIGGSVRWVIPRYDRFALSGE